MALADLRRKYLTRPIFAWAQKALPQISDTEREALDAGDVWWDGELFSGNPNWAVLLAVPPAKLSPEEQAFLDGPVNELCRLVDDWKVTWELHDLPPPVWEFIKANRFFGMIIPKQYGGLGFSAFAHSEIIRKISTRSIAAAVTVMVPNSLGPGELLVHFGTETQRQHWLPRLADGREIPCFALTSEDAGSDAAAMVDTGVVCKGTFDGKDVVGIRLNWHKRYTTLAPIATVLGLAFKCRDPDRLLGGEEDRGITLALVPTNLPGVDIGSRHIPAYQAFQNGPSAGRDVFIPLDFIIGGSERIGQGWKLLMAALAAGRGISLPSLSSAGAAFAARTSGAYARIREQFHVPIGKFEGIEEPLSRIAATAYLLDAARRFTCAGLDQGKHPAVVSAIMKYHATERMRAAVNDAMDIHAGKAVIDGPHNYIGNLHRAIPIGITVEGANIVTRNLIIFGQGAIRCHPFLFKEMMALQEPDADKALARFDDAFWRHVGHSLATAGRAWLRNWTGGLIATAPAAGPATKFYRQLSRHSASFALVADMALLTLGGTLKRKEMLSARLGDILSELFLLSGALKRWQDEGSQAADLPLLTWCMQSGFKTIGLRLGEVLQNLPNRVAAVILRLIIQPLGSHSRGPSDHLSQQCAELLLEPSPTRDRVTAGIYLAADDNGFAQLEHAFTLVTDAEPLAAKLKAARLHDVDEARRHDVLTDAEVAQLGAARAAVARAIAVDDFPAAALKPADEKR